jgi:tetratricopeptide (TPR) repeat protein
VLDDSLADRATILSRAQTVFAAGDPIEAEALFAQANAIAPLEGESAAAYERLLQRLEPVREQVEIFRQGEWEVALRELWRSHQADPDNQVITDLMVDCYYNLGVRDLQRGDTVSAEEMFHEGLRLRPDDRELERLVQFAKRYQRKSQDLLYRIFVKYLPFH